VGKRLVAVVVVVVVAAWGALRLLATPFPSDHTPEGAYLRIAKAMAEDDPKQMFAYLETDAQWASFTIRDVRKQALDRVRRSYPEAERVAFERAYRAEAEAPDGPDVFAAIAARRGWTGRLRKDLSGVAKVEIDGPRATVVTARGTRYPFRVRENGIWGLTIFTADLVAESERASRDLAVVTAAADDYDRGRGAPTTATTDAGVSDSSP
jgi:hypothetical protein